MFGTKNKKSKEPKRYQSVEAQFCQEVAGHFTADAPKVSMLSILLSNIGDLITMIDNSEGAQLKAGEVLDYVAAEWPNRRKGAECQVQTPE